MDPVEQKLMDADWNVVDVQITYVDRGEPKVIVHTLDRLEIQEKERQSMRDAATEWQANGGSDEALEEALREIDEYEVTVDEFKRRVLDGARSLATSPLKVPTPVTNQIRILPPWAVKEVSIQVRDVASVARPQ